MKALIFITISASPRGVFKPGERLYIEDEATTEISQLVSGGFAYLENGDGTPPNSIPGGEIIPGGGELP